jgi:hypothetical protein
MASTGSRAEHGEPLRLGEAQGTEKHGIDDGEIAVVAPIESASVAMATAVKPGESRSIRSA